VNHDFARILLRLFLYGREHSLSFHDLTHPLSPPGIAESESKIIRNLIRFRNIQVDDIMTPRTVVSKLPEDMTCGDAIKADSLSRFSRIPIHSEDAEHITGYVLKQQILEQVAFDKHDTILSEIKRPIRLVSEHDSLSSLFNNLFSHKEQMALVVD
jgi:CBS domain containing-hemolysin-like protein